MMTELFYTVWLFFVETKYHVFFFKNIQVSHILLCSWFWSTLLWFFFFTVLHLSTFTFSLWSFIAAYFLLLFSTMLLLVCLNVDVYVSVCVCVCVQCFKNAFNVLNLRISLQYLSSIYVKRVHVCVQRHPKFAKSIPLTSGRLVCTVVWKGWI